jgi:hypothetical protein
MSWNGRRHHDLGGEPAGPVHWQEHGYEQWEQRVDALMVLLSQRRDVYLRIDEIRQCIESLGPTAYAKLGYYEKWMHAIAQTMIAHGMISIEELGRSMEEKGA